MALRQYGSVAEDAGTMTRNAKFLIQKVLHRTGLIEVGAQQAAAANLGYNSFFTSHKFCYVFIWDAVRRLRRHNFGEDSREDDSDGDDFESVLDLDEDCIFFSITQFDRYIWRSPALGHLSLYDYSCCISHSKVRKKSRDREANLFCRAQ